MVSWSGFVVADKSLFIAVDNGILQLCAFASSAIYRSATYDSRGSNCCSEAEGGLVH